MSGIAATVPPWAVGLMLITLSALFGVVIKLVTNRYSRLEDRVDNLDDCCHRFESELKQKADYRHLEKEVEKLANRNHADLKDIQKQIAESMKTMHGRLDDLHVIFINFMTQNQNKKE